MPKLAIFPLLFSFFCAILACDGAEPATDAAAGAGPSGAGTAGAGLAGTGGATTSGGAGTSSTTPPAPLPWLRVEGNQIKDPAGNPVILRGVSLIDLSVTEDWEGGVARMIDRLTKIDDTQGSSPGWYTRVLRFAVVPEDGESESPMHYQPGSDLYYRTLLRPAVDYALGKGLYVIIDWHYIDDTNKHVETTNTFWADMAPRFANDSHVMFELYNEPINGGNWPSVKADMQRFYDTARAGAPENLILVGAPNWSQIVGPAATDPVVGTNIVYVAHMYPQHWPNASLRQQILTAAAVHPVFVTEWGFQENANEILAGTITSYGTPFKQFLEENRLSWTAWCASNNWGPPMFDRDYNLRVGEGEMGGFVKDFLYEKRDSDRPAAP